MIFIPVHGPGFQAARDDPVDDGFGDEAHGVEEAVAGGHVAGSDDACWGDEDQGSHHGGEVGSEGGRDAAAERVAYEAEAAVGTARSRRVGRRSGR